MLPREIEELVRLTQDTELGGDIVRHDGQTSPKARFRDLGMRYLKELAPLVGLAKCDFEVTFNPGGPAVAGESMLSSTRFFVQIGVSTCGILYRRCERLPCKPVKGKQTYRYDCSGLVRDAAGKPDTTLFTSGAHAVQPNFGNHWFPPTELLSIDSIVKRLLALEVTA